jgi:autotransporter-associated beta strand protein
MKLRLLKQLMLASVTSLSLVANAQTLTLTNGVQKYASLTSTTANLSGRCELWVTNAATPLAGCTINLNSTDAWLFLPGIKPSAVVSTYLSQVLVGGAGAVADSNVRVVQYGQNGAIVIPQSSSFQPLTVFTGAEFTGTATSCSQWANYTGTAYTNISSFKLKRGYQAVLAQSANGANYSKCYVAQDGDLEVGVLPATLGQQVQFIYVTPWRWTSKKGIAGNPPYSLLNVNWWYDWNIDSSSSRDLEYVAIHQLRYWPGMNQNWQSLGINIVLGYNEPDNTAQADIAVGDAFWSWPDLLGTGLRVGSPACSDGGVSSWLLPFMTDIATSQANEDNAPGLRVDFVAQHYYQAADPSNPSACASQMYNFLLNIWNNTHLPIWVTEWNNGATWTDGSPYAAPTYAQQQADIQAMTQMLESTPFVERYALYNWVDDTRSLVTSSNTVTPAGVTYSNLVSAIGYSQAMPDNGTRGIAEFLFATNTWDTSGYYNNAMAIGAPNYSTGHLRQAQSIILDGANSYVQLPVNVAEGSAFTFAAWVYWNGGNAWQRIFDFGAVSTVQGGTPSQYMFLTPSSGSTPSTLRFAINNGSGEQIVERSGALASGSWQHIAVTLNGSSAILYVNGAPVATNSSVSVTPSAFSPTKNYLGKSQFTDCCGDPLFNGKLDEVEIADYAMTPAQISALYSSAQPASGGIWTTNASGNWGTNNNWSSGIAANGTGFIADFSTIYITANRTVTLDSTRTIGGLKFGTTTGSQSWFLSGTNTLTLDAGGGNVPVIAVNQNTATISAPMSGSYGFTKTGGGTLTLSGANTDTGVTTVSAGTLNYSGTLGESPATAAAQINVGVAGGGNATLNIQSGANIRMNNANMLAGNGTSVTAGDGFVYQSGGAITGINQLQLGAGASGASYGYYNLSGSASVSLLELDLGSFNGAAVGVLDMSGGTLNVTNWFVPARGTGGTGILNLTGGTFNYNGPSGQFMANWSSTAGTAVCNIANASLIASNANVNMMSTAASGSLGEINLLSGGLMQANSIAPYSATGTSLVNFNGGTLKANTVNTTFITANNTAVNVYGKGGTINNNGVNLTIPEVLSAPAGNGLNAAPSVTSGGSGYLGAPAVTFTGGGGVGASGYATISGGAVNGIVITSPGTGYGSTPTITLTGGGYTTAATATVPAPAANTSGGMTFQGSGTTTLSGANTYTGTTTINAGTLALSNARSITNSKSIVVASGAVFDVSAVTGGFTLGAAQTLSGSGSVNGVVTNNGTLAPGASGTTGTLTFSNSPVLNGVTLIKINRNNGAPLNDQIILPASAITYRSTLTVSNISAALTAGDSFKIFSAAGYHGAFATLNLPTLGTGLVWNTNPLSNGVLSVVTTVGPQFASLTQTAGGNFRFNGSGAAGVTYELDAATNLMPPVLWMFVTNAVADQNGLFQLWDLSATNFPQKFYRLTGSQ